MNIFQVWLPGLLAIVGMLGFETPQTLKIKNNKKQTHPLKEKEWEIRILSARKAGICLVNLGRVVDNDTTTTTNNECSLLDLEAIG